jgi:probable F420-dependent oxidoreductase
VTAVGLALPQLGPHVTADAIRVFCERAEALGYASLWVQDHFAYPLDPEGGYAGVAGVAVPEPYRHSLTALEVLSVTAAWTSRVRIGTSVLVAGHHRPAPLAKQLATLDILSGGRLSVGLGVGWCYEEHAMCDVDARTRGSRMDDFIPALLACWGPGPVSYEGPVFTIPPCELLPLPLQRPRPPLLAGMWSPAGRRRTARYFDGWNPAGMSTDQVVAAMAEITALRDPALPALTVHHRIFAEFPGGRPGHQTPGVGGVTRETEKARRAGIDEVIIDANFWGEVSSPDGWMELPDRLSPTLEAAAG